MGCNHVFQLGVTAETKFVCCMLADVKSHTG